MHFISPMVLKVLQYQKKILWEDAESLICCLDHAITSKFFTTKDKKHDNRLGRSQVNKEDM